MAEPIFGWFGCKVFSLDSTLVGLELVEMGFGDERGAIAWRERAVTTKPIESGVDWRDTQREF
jgi:hypothetical protein